MEKGTVRNRREGDSRPQLRQQFAPTRTISAYAELAREHPRIVT